MKADLPIERDVDVVIVTFNSARDVAASIASARSWARVASVVVVDNDSRDRSADVATAVADIVVPLPHNVGYGAAQNRGAAATAAPYLLLLNPDARINPAALEAGRRVLERSLDVAAVEGSIVRAADGVEERWQGREPGLGDLVARLLDLRTRFGERRLRWMARGAGLGYYAERRLDGARAVEFLAAVAPLVRRRAFHDVGGFDEAFFLYAEDVDLCRRLRGAGWRVVGIPEFWATHQGGASSAGTGARQRRLWWESHRLLVQRHWTGPRRWTGLALSRVGSALSTRAERRAS